MYFTGGSTKAVKGSFPPFIPNENTMKAASIHELKGELKTLSPAQLLEICLRLAKYKKENKELITYLLLEAQDEASYVKSIKEEVDGMFNDIRRNNLYLAKKTIRKILGIITRNIKYSGSHETEVELLLYFCQKLRGMDMPLYTSVTISNLYLRQIQKIQKAIATMHEDLQHDYQEELKPLVQWKR